jgi:hypothetical protein
VQYAAHVPTFEDKVAQRAIVMVLEAVYEQGLPSLLIRLPARSLGSSGIAVPAHCYHGAKD